MASATKVAELWLRKAVSVEARRPGRPGQMPLFRHPDSGNMVQFDSLPPEAKQRVQQNEQASQQREKKRLDFQQHEQERRKREKAQAESDEYDRRERHQEDGPAQLPHDRPGTLELQPKRA